jgi:Ni/Co efflux regulator RcnB
VIAIGGRATTTKGFQTLADVAIDLDPAYEVRIFGPEAGGMGPSISFRIYEALHRHHGWVGERVDPKKRGEEFHSEKDAAIHNLASVNAGYPWVLRNGFHKLTYTGPFLDAIAAWTEVALAVQLSTDSIVTTFEYTTLEALDAGCSLILPEYYRRDMGGVLDYDVRFLERFTRGASLGNKGIRWDDTVARSELIDKINDAVHEIEAGAHDPEVNRRALERYHAPRHLAAKLEEIL